MPFIYEVLTLCSYSLIYPSNFVLYSVTSVAGTSVRFSCYTPCAAQNLPLLTIFKCQNACQVAACVAQFHFSVKWSGNVFSLKFTFVCACGEKWRKEKYNWSLRLESARVGCYDCPHPSDGPRNSRLFSEPPAVHTVSDTTAVQYLPLL
jgi:hypothetical protein